VRANEFAVGGGGGRGNNVGAPKPERFGKCGPDRGGADRRKSTRECYTH